MKKNINTWININILFPLSSTNYRVIFFSLSLFFLPLYLTAQSSFPYDSLKNNYKLLFETDLEAEYFTIDKLQNIFYTSKKNEVIKLKEDGTEQFRFINKTLGRPTHIDATNPFNLLLFYPDYQNVVTLDRTMNMAGQYNLFALGLFGINAVGMAGDGNIWVYDNLDFRLKKLDQNGKVLVQSGDMSLELDEAIAPNYVLERGQLVYLNDPSKGIFVFDVFGKYLKILPIKKVENFQVIGDELLYCRSGEVHSFHLVTFLHNQVILPEPLLQGDVLKVGKDRLYILQKEKLKVYQF